MKDLVIKQLQQSIDTMQKVLADDAIHTAVVQAGELTAKAMKAGRKLMVCGNGGSAADSQHLVAEFVSRLTVDRPALRAVALTTDTSILTAIGNDYSYDNVFERQVEALANEGDVLLAISTSGNSKNCVKALQLARTMGVHTIAYTGNDRRYHARARRHQRHHPLPHHHEHPGVPPRPRTHLLHGRRALLLRPRLRLQAPTARRVNLVSMPVKPLHQADLDHILTHTSDVFAALRGARIFLTGGTGFFGHWLVESLLHANRALSLGIHATLLTRSATRFHTRAPFVASDPAITLLEGDIRTFPFPATAFSHIVHAATDSGGQQAEQPAYVLAESILEGTRRVLTLARRHSTPRLLYVSTGAVYGRSSATEIHIPETSTAGPDPLLLRSSYDEAKRMSEHLCIAYTDATPTQAVIARPFAFVGPHLPLDQHFAIGNFIGAALANTPIHIRGDGTPLRSWLYMADLAIWLWHILVRGAPARAYNVGSEDAHTIADAAHLTAATLRPGLPIQIDGTPDPAAPMNSYVPSTQRASSELGLTQTIDLAEALRRTAVWHRS